MRQTQIEEFIDKGYQLKVERRFATKEILSTIWLGTNQTWHQAIGSSVEESLERLEAYLQGLVPPQCAAPLDKA